MEKEQIKTILVNTMTVLVVGGVLVSIYIVFFKKDTSITTTVATVASVAKIAEETAQIGTQIDYTVNDLGDLASAVASSKVIFDLPAFKNLQDFSVEVPPQSVGRQNPFVPTSWKAAMKALESSTGNSASAPADTSSPSSAPNIVTPEVPVIPASGI